jgi:hypothetical protein
LRYPQKLGHALGKILAGNLVEKGSLRFQLSGGAWQAERHPDLLHRRARALALDHEMVGELHRVFKPHGCLAIGKVRARSTSDFQLRYFVLLARCRRSGDGEMEFRESSTSALRAPTLSVHRQRKTNKKKSSNS